MKTLHKNSIIVKNEPFLVTLCFYFYKNATTDLMLLSVTGTKVAERQAKGVGLRVRRAGRRHSWPDTRRLVR